MAKNDILRAYLSRVKDRIIESQANLGIRLTGFSANSIVIVRSRSVKTGRFVAGASLVSVDYLTTNFHGVGVNPGVFPPFGKASKLFNWVNARGFRIIDNDGRIMNSEQTSFLLALNIFRRGTKINRGVSPGIPFDQIIEDELPDTLDAIAKDESFSIIEKFNKAILS